MCNNLIIFVYTIFNIHVLHVHIFILLHVHVCNNLIIFVYTIFNILHVHIFILLHVCANNCIFPGMRCALPASLTPQVLIFVRSSIGN